MSIKKLILIILLVIISGFITYWVASIVKCEIQTSKYGKEFVGLELQTNMLGSADTLKVLEYSKETAIVYYKEKYGGDILEFHKENNIWIYKRWLRTVWSKSGSADGFIWPYIR